jgi:hypothetical protein
MKIRALLVVVAVSGLFFVPGSSSASSTTPDPCTAAAANSTINITTATQKSDVVSPDGSYATTACGGYIVDVKGVDFNPSATGAVATLATNKQACELSADAVRYFKKAAGAANFTELGSGFTKGVWHDGGTGFMANTCQMVYAGPARPPFVTALKGDTIRVVVRATEYVMPAKVKISGSPSFPGPG